MCKSIMTAVALCTIFIVGGLAAVAEEKVVLHISTNNWSRIMIFGFFKWAMPLFFQYNMTLFVNQILWPVFINN